MPAKLPRRLPQYSELRPLMQFAPPRFGTEARLAKVADVWDLRRIARRRTPKAAFDYTDGAALREIGYARNRAAFDNVELVPAILSGSATVDLSVDIAGGRSALPFGIAPTGFTRFMQTEGEFGGAGAAGEMGVPYTCRRWEPGRSRRSPSTIPTRAAGSSSTCGPTGTSPAIC